eukprot:3037442-Pleurochrysis_carterae.AAC.1
MELRHTRRTELGKDNMGWTEQSATMWKSLPQDHAYDKNLRIGARLVAPRVCEKGLPCLRRATDDVQRKRDAKVRARM